MSDLTWGSQSDWEAASKSDVTVENDTFQLASAIPDAVDYHWPQDAGSGTTATAEIGDVDLDINNGDNWTDRSEFSGGTAPLLDGDDDYEITQSNIDINGDKATVCGWVYDLGTAGDYNPRVFATISDPSEYAWVISDGWSLALDQATNEWRLGVVSGGSYTDCVRQTGPDAAGNDLFVALSVNGDSARLRIYDSSGTKQFDESGNANRGTTSSAPLMIGAGVGDYTSGNPDNIFVSTSSEMSDTELEQIINATSR
jgi:hypothetical protein